MKEKIINYIETLEAKAYQSDDYFKQRNDLYIENQNKDKEIERLNKNKKEALEFIERYLQLNLEEFNANSLLNKLKEILERDIK